MEHLIDKHLLDWVEQQGLKQVSVAYSGGIDSTVLLYALSQITGLSITALHIDHQLNHQARQWVAHCQAFCQQHHIEIRVARAVGINGQSNLEAQARNARYEALYQMVGEHQVLATAHHSQDQTETILHHLLRGSGLRGLCGMNASHCYQSMTILRPLLSISPLQIEEYARFHHLSYLTDPSNDNTDYDRNYIRHRILPAVYKRWPSADRQVSNCARHLSETEEFLQSQTTIHVESDQIHIEQLALSTQPLFHQQIQSWLAQKNLLIPSETWLTELKRAVINAQADRVPTLKIDRFVIRRYDNKLYITAPVYADFSHLSIPFEQYQNHPIRMRQVKGYGIASKYLKKTVIQFRRGGETFKKNNTSPRKSLKNCFQSWRIPPWLRSQIPLIYIDESLVSIGQYATSDAFSCQPNEEGFYFEKS
ncbi:MAG: tRNA lysidine(34) synthetase TilS [Legionellales bacterium]|nr:tRNA lysidine(34) synthetase TilS [Legionellales bacterium]|tara:strand:+ start:1452 stop:2717 length:1266 start_codon:yes stop_codon:yes gene_type:complete